jgi:hypothetical protein
MDHYRVFPERAIGTDGPISAEFSTLNIRSFQEACRHAHELPYGYNSDRDDLMILFKEKMGTCTTKHAVIATLAQELQLPVQKNIGIYAMTEDLVTGTCAILAEFGLPYIPMLHCFLGYGKFRVDLTEGNHNGKNRSIEVFLHVEQVAPSISAKDEYLLYRKALSETIMKRPELNEIDLKRILRAREQGLKLLRENVALAR